MTINSNTTKVQPGPQHPSVTGSRGIVFSDHSGMRGVPGYYMPQVTLWFDSPADLGDAIEVMNGIFSTWMAEQLAASAPTEEDNGTQAES